MLRARRNKFIGKLYAILSNKQNQSVISWSRHGSSFMIFEESQLPKILQSHKMSNQVKSFYRQLRLYGFKMSKNKQGVREYKHPEFNINFSNELNPIFRKNQPIHQLQIELNDLRKFTQTLQLQQLQILRNLHLTIQTHNYIKRFMEFINEWFYSGSKNAIAHKFVKTLFTIFLGHKQQFDSTYTTEEILKDCNIDIEIYTPHALC